MSLHARTPTGCGSAASQRATSSCSCSQVDSRPGGRARVDVAGEPGLGQSPRERLLAKVAPARPGPPAIGEAPEAPLQEMPDGQAADRVVVAVDRGQVEPDHLPAKLDDRRPGGEHRLGHRYVADPGDDPVPSPAAEPGGDLVLRAPLLDVDRPGAVPLDVAADPAEQAAVVLLGRLDDQGDVGKGGHGLGPAADGVVKPEMRLDPIQDRSQRPSSSRRVDTDRDHRLMGAVSPQ